MLNVLLESKAQHTRRVGGTLASAVIHGAIITAAVVLTVQEAPHRIVGEPPVRPPIYVPTNPAPAPAPTTRPPVSSQTSERPLPPSVPLPPMEPIMTVQTVVTEVSPIGQGNMPIGPAIAPTGPATGPAGLGGPEGGVMEAQYVEKPPRVLRSENPRFPDALRARGLGGRVVVQFVVDTLGRAEMSEFKIVDATDSLLGDAVRAVLPRFRFTAGEAAGRKVRTMVALPFDFTLVR
jgi:protein TonB